ncbi:MAG: hypothetical protein WCK28_06055 [Burkholderiales bacterium]
MLTRIRCELAASLEEVPSLPADPQELAEELGRNPDEVRQDLSAAVLLFFRVEGGRIFDDQLIRQRAEAKANREARAKGAERTNAKKAAAKATQSRGEETERDAERSGDRDGDRDGHRVDERTLPSITFSSLPSSSLTASKAAGEESGVAPRKGNPAEDPPLTDQQREYAEQWVREMGAVLPDDPDFRADVVAYLQKIGSAAAVTPTAPVDSFVADHEQEEARRSSPSPTRRPVTANGNDYLRQSRGV